MIEVDQSIKMEQTHADTRIGIVKGSVSILVLMDSKLKRTLFEASRFKRHQEPAHA